jgi:hypothetical protein
MRTILLCVLVAGCGGSLQQQAPTIIRGTLGTLYGACQSVDVDDPTWRAICDRVDAVLPGGLNQLGAGPAELPADVAAREVTITIGAE